MTDEREAQPRIDDVLQLAAEYGSIADIPPEVLAGVGYVALEDGHIAPEGFEPKPKQTFEELLAAKNEARPFDRIEFAVDRAELGRAAQTFTREGLLVKMSSHTERIFDWYTEPELLKNTVGSFFAFAADNVKPETQHTVDALTYDYVATRLEHSVMTEWTATGVLPKGISELRDIYFATDIDVAGADALTSAEMSAIWTELEKVRARLADPDQASDPFDWLYEVHKLDPTKTITNDDIDKAFPNFMAVLEDNGFFESPQADPQAMYHEFASRYPTAFAPIVETWSDFLGSRGLQFAADRLRAATTAPEATAVLKQEFAASQDLATKNQVITELKVAIRAAPDELSRRNLSGELACQKKEFKALKQLLQGSVDLFDVQRLVSNVVQREIKAVQSSLMIVTASTGYTIQLELDGAMDAEKDYDPGAFSGDCTVGLPLAFDDPEVPVYNVKVYDRVANKHIGNIYLLVAEVDDGAQSWHLEATQIPDNRIDWATFPQHLVTALAKQAEQNGIDFITCNNKSPTISNFDYIGDSLLRYGQAQQEKTTTDGIVIEYPEVKRDRHSHFQGGGMATVLWRNPRTS